MFKTPFSLKGRIRRSEFGISYIIITIINFIVMGFSMYLADKKRPEIFQHIKDQYNNIDDSSLYIIAEHKITLYAMQFSGPVVLITSLLFLPQIVKRCHDLGKSGWFCLVPIFNPFWLLFADSESSFS